jgi:hypothetical protein
VLTNDGWEVRMYLGATEIVGGKDDGQSQLVSFELDVARLNQAFTHVDAAHWTVSGGTDGTNSSFLTVRGSVDEHELCLKVYSRAPLEAGPAFRQHSDGSLDSVTL